MSQEVNNARNASVDLLRCVLMFLIVCHHAAYDGYYATDTDSWYLGLLFSALIMWHVDCFIAITGYYGTKFSMTKFFKLYGIVLFYSAIQACYSYFVLKVPLYKVAKIEAGWFGATYLWFLLIVPFLNLALVKISSLERRLGLRIWLILNVGVILNFVPFRRFGVFPHGGGGMTLLTFIIIYLNNKPL